jgi:hypothetical protein
VKAARMTRTTSSPSESIAVLKVSTMDAQYQTKRPPVRPAGASFNPWEGLTPYLNLAQGGLAGCLRIRLRPMPY